MHSLVVGLLAVAGCVGASLAGLLFVRRGLSRESLAGLREAAGAMSGLLGAIYGVLLAFIVLVAWTDFQDTQAAIDSEASRIGDLSRLARGFGPETETAMRRGLEEYLKAVIESDWPALREGRDTTRAWRALQDVWGTYRGVEPRTEREAALYRESLAALSDVSDSRRLRIAAARETLPGLMWLLLWSGAGLLLGVSLLVSAESARLQAAMTAALAALIGLSLFLIYSLDHPYRMAGSLDPERFAAELARISQPDKE